MVGFIQEIPNTPFMAFILILGGVAIFASMFFGKK
jgi:hypothetical protein